MACAIAPAYHKKRSKFYTSEYGVSLKCIDRGAKIVMSELEARYDILSKIYNKYRKAHPENSDDSEQICLMWPTNNPPDIIEGTAPFVEIEEVFNIVIDEKDSLELYDMTLKEASIRVHELQNLF